MKKYMFIFIMIGFCFYNLYNPEINITKVEVQNKKLLEGKFEVTSDTLIIEDNYVKSVPAKTEKTKFIPLLKAQNAKLGINCENGTNYIGTSCILNITPNNHSKIDYKIVVTGDLNGDGINSVTDAVKMATYQKDKTSLKEKSYILASDLDNNNDVTHEDIASLAQYVVRNLEVPVTNNFTNLNSIEVVTKSLVIEKGKTRKIEYKSTNEETIINWKSSNEEVVKVDETGLITARAGGKATITATTMKNKTIDIAIEVVVIVPITGITLSDGNNSINESDTITMNVGSTKGIITTITPSNATTNELTWTSSDSSIVSVDTTGRLTANNAGTVTITATTPNGISTSFKVNAIIPVSEIIMNNKELTLYIDETSKLTATIIPSNATNQNLTWTSSDKKIVTVDESGKVTALSPGTATITVTGDNNIKATCIVTVKKTTIVINQQELRLYIGDESQLTTTVTPGTATIENLIWTSSDKEIVTVDETGKITALSEGTATITVTGDDNITATSTITVKKPKVTIDQQELSLYIRDEIQLTTTAIPSMEKVGKLTWTSSDKEIVTVDETGKITALSEGTATITVTGTNNITATSTITVKKPKITIDQQALNLDIGDKIQLTTTLTPNISESKNLIWTSSNSNIVSIDETGKITALSPGTAIITVTGQHNIIATSIVTVKKPKITINQQELQIYIGETYQLTTTITPSISESQNLTWLSSDKDIVTVDEIGKITAVSPGTATITVTGQHNITTTSTITVKNPTITINHTDLNLFIGETSQLTATITPSNSITQKLVWTTSDPNIVTVDETGKVTAKTAGTATITATGVNKITTTTTITVKNPTITLNYNELSLYVEEEEQLTATITPSNSATQELVWTTSDPNIVTIDETGKIIAKIAGTATVTATGFNNITATCKITVKNPTITVTNNNISLMDEETTSIDVTVVGTSMSNITWTSGNSSIATVSVSGTTLTIKGTGVGTTTITGTVNNNPAVTTNIAIDVREIKILMVGNSKTYQQSIGTKLKNIAAKSGYTTNITWFTKSDGVGGKNLKYIYDNQKSTITKSYDYAIMQELVDTMLYDYDTFNSGVSSISNAVVSKNANVKLYLRQSWLQESEEGDNFENYKKTAYGNVDKIIKNSKHDITLIREGESIYEVDAAGITVFKDDYSRHQTILGAYHVANCVYARIFNEDPTKNTYTDSDNGYSGTTATKMKKIAKEYCYVK